MSIFKFKQNMIDPAQRIKRSNEMINWLLIFWCFFISGWVMFYASIASAETSAADKIFVMLDPGHGGEDEGIHFNGSILEKTLTLQMAQELKNESTKRSGTIMGLTRAQDMAVPLLDRTILANRSKADFFISLHFAVASKEEPAGNITVWYYKPIQNQNAQKFDSRATTNSQIIPWQTAQIAMISQSQKLAEVIQKKWEKSKLRFSAIPHVKIGTAPIAVMTGLQSPSIFLEVNLPGAEQAVTAQLLNALRLQINTLLLDAIYDYGEKAR